MGARLVPLLLVLLLVAPGASAGAQDQAARASLPDIEDEVMCLECRTALNVSNSAVADQERAFIAGLIAEGLTKAEVKAALVEEYGPRVLAEPQDEGFELAAWLVPLLAGGGAVALVALTARRWRRAPAGAGAAADGARPDPDDERRLDAELAAFDR